MYGLLGVALITQLVKVLNGCKCKPVRRRTDRPQQLVSHISSQSETKANSPAYHVMFWTISVSRLTPVGHVYARRIIGVLSVTAPASWNQNKNVDAPVGEQDSGEKHDENRRPTPSSLKNETSAQRRQLNHSAFFISAQSLTGFSRALKDVFEHH